MFKKQDRESRRNLKKRVISILLSAVMAISTCIVLLPSISVTSYADNVVSFNANIDEVAVYGANPDDCTPTITDVSNTTQNNIVIRFLHWNNSDSSGDPCEEQYNAFGYGTYYAVFEVYTDESSEVIINGAAPTHKRFIMAAWRCYVPVTIAQYYNITLQTNIAKGTPSSSPSGSATQGTEVTLSNTMTDDAYEFIEWTSNDVTITNSTSATGASFTMPGNAVTVTANYEQRMSGSHTVIFRVQNGKWDDDSTGDVEVVLEGYVNDTKNLASTDIPSVGSKPASGYVAGSWNTTPSTSTGFNITSEGATTTYIYTYSIPPHPETAENNMERTEEATAPEAPIINPPKVENKNDGDGSATPERPYWEANYGVVENFVYNLKKSGKLGAAGQSYVIKLTEGNSLNLKTLEFLKKNPFLTIDYQFIYKGKKMRALIPGALVFTSPTIKYYGPEWLYAYYGVLDNGSPFGLFYTFPEVAKQLLK